MNTQQTLLEIKNLKTHFFTKQGVAKAVNDVSFSLKSGEILGIVGESGCGKSVTAQSIMRLVAEPPGKIVDGQINFDGLDIAKIPIKQMNHIRGNRISMIFQEPMTSLNPVKTIGNQIGEMFRRHNQSSYQESKMRTIEMLDKVQIPGAKKRLKDFPFQLSGGMRQRIMIAIALSCNPEILIADEPTTALDVTVQAQIIDLMLNLQQDFQTSILMITHDLGVIAEMANRVIIMYAGKIVESGDVTSIFENPKHPYTKGLLRSVPVLGQASQGNCSRLQEIKGMVPSLYNGYQGCAFEPRCLYAKEECRTKTPELTEVSEGQKVSCWQ